MEHAIEIVIEYKRQQWAQVSKLGDRRDWNGCNEAEERAIAAEEILALLRAESKSSTASVIDTTVAHLVET